jgi:hypothetical protein
MIEPAQSPRRGGAAALLGIAIAAFILLLPVEREPAQALDEVEALGAP